MPYAWQTGPSYSGDSGSYIALAEAISHGALIVSERTPAYPLLIGASEAVGSLLGLEPFRALLIVQVVLLAGLGTYLVHDLTVRATGSLPMATIAALLYVGDADTQNLGGWIMTEALAVPLFLGAIWRRQRDGSWKRGGWLVAALVMTRPQFVFLPPLLAAIELVRRRSIRASLTPLVPSVLLVAAWTLALSSAGVSVHEPVAVFVPRHAVGKIFEFDLWRAIPESPATRLFAEERALGHDAFVAQARLAHDVGPDAWIDVSLAVLTHAPGALALATLRAAPRAFRQASLWTPAKPGAAFRRAVRWHECFWGLLFWPPPMLAVFAGLLAVATTTGFGRPRLRQLYAWTATPVTVTLFAAIAVMAMGTDQVGRLCICFRPLYFVVIGCALGWGVERVTAGGTRRSVAATCASERG